VKAKLVENDTPVNGVTMHRPGSGAWFVVMSNAAYDATPVSRSVQLNVNVTEEPTGSVLAARDRNSGTAESEVEAEIENAGGTEELNERSKLASFAIQTASHATAVVTCPCTTSSAVEDTLLPNAVTVVTVGAAGAKAVTVT
jgi:hypothetical protein